MLSGNGRHRRLRQAPALVVAAGVAGSAIAIPLLGAAGAHAADGTTWKADNTTWNRLANCESGGSWSAHPGNGYFGGLMLSPNQWLLYGGLDYAPRPDQASRHEQIAVAQKVLADRGPQAWPGCADIVGLGGKGGASSPEGPSGVGGDWGSSHDAGTGTHADPYGSSGRHDEGGGFGPHEDASQTPTDTSPDAPGSPPSSGKGPSSGSTGESGSGHGDDGATPSGKSSGSTSGDQGSDGSGRHRGDRAREGSGEAAGDHSRSAGRHASRDVDGADGADEGGADDGGAGGADGGGAGGAGGADGGGVEGVYTVRSGDNLWGIAGSHDVEGGWRALYVANEKTIGADPGLIRPGQKLDLS